jgi:RNA polymerase-binding transcription factor DksA
MDIDNCNSHKGDVIDQAQALEAQLTRAAESLARSAARPEQVQNPDGSWPTEECVDCGEPIGWIRLSQGRVRCIDCQTEKEQRSKQYAR